MRKFYLREPRIFGGITDPTEEVRFEGQRAVVDTRWRHANIVTRAAQNAIQSE